METHGPRTPIPEVPVDDGALDRALADVDANLTAWLTAAQAVLRSAQDPATDAATEQAASGVEETSGVERTPDAAEPVADTDASAETPLAKSHTVEAGPTADAAPRAAQGAPAALSTAEVMPLPPSADASARVDDSPDEMAETRPPIRPESADAEVDEEQLLASLDEQTRAAIRVRRRLSGNRRSVRELLEEIKQTELPKETTKPQPKRWWRRQSS